MLIKRVLSDAAATPAPQQLASKLPNALHALMMYLHPLLEQDDRWAGAWVPFGLWLEGLGSSDQAKYVDQWVALLDAGQPAGEARQALAESLLELRETFVR